MGLPIYYLPPGTIRPSHIKSMAPNQLMPGAGPDGLGGCTYGGAYRPDEASSYHRAEADGWYVNVDGVTPKDLLRTNAIPGFDVDGWLVPRILDGDTSVVGYWNASGFVVPENLRPLVDGLRGILDYVGPLTLAHALLAAELLRVNYHATIIEFGLLEVLTADRSKRILMAGAGIPPSFVLPTVGAGAA